MVVDVERIEEFIRELREQARSARDEIAPRGALGNVGHVQAEVLEQVALDLAATIIAFEHGPLGAARVDELAAIIKRRMWADRDGIDQHDGIRAVDELAALAKGE